MSVTQRAGRAAGQSADPVPDKSAPAGLPSRRARLPVNPFPLCGPLSCICLPHGARAGVRSRQQGATFTSRGLSRRHQEVPHLMLSLLRPQLLLTGDLLLLGELEHLRKRDGALSSLELLRPHSISLPGRCPARDRAFFAFGLVSMSRRAFAAFSRASGSSAVAFAPCEGSPRAEQCQLGLAAWRAARVRRRMRRKSKKSLEHTTLSLSQRAVLVAAST